jgi:hypothetical protein
MQPLTVTSLDEPTDPATDQILRLLPKGHPLVTPERQSGNLARLQRVGGLDVCGSHEVCLSEFMRIAPFVGNFGLAYRDRAASHRGQCRDPRCAL